MDKHGAAISYYADSGFKQMEVQHRNGWMVTETVWHPDGKVSSQTRREIRNMKVLSEDKKTSPPWWWPVDDQTEPTAPWWNEQQ